MLISIITPTYNRAYILPALYKSLCSQTVKDFEWIIIDDGSTDSTLNVVTNFINEGKIRIKYIFQENGGKHRAHNKGVDSAEGILCVCVDSDDQLAPRAIELALKEWQDNQDKSIIGILALRGDLKTHEPICSQIPNHLKKSSFTVLRDKYHFVGDTVLFFRSELLKVHKFPEFDGEKFLTEANLYCDLEKSGEMLLVNEVWYYCEYRHDGITAIYGKLMLTNPIGAADTYLKMSLNTISFIKKLKYAIIFQAYNSLVPENRKREHSFRPLIYAIAKLGAPIFKIKYFRPLMKK